MDVVEQYVDTFGEGPPIFELDDEQAVVLMLRAIADGIPMQDISTD